MARVMEDGIELFNIAKSAGHRYQYRYCGSEDSEPSGPPNHAQPAETMESPLSGDWHAAGAAARLARAARVGLRSCSWGRGGWAGSRFLLRLVT
jgi:hypothetical protein